MGRVGRFQVMAALQAARARALGLSPDEAESWGLNRAIFYAAAKRGFGRRAPGHHAGRHAPDTPTTARAAEEMVTVGGEQAYAVRDPRHGLRFRFGDETQTPEDFEQQVKRRFADWDAAWAEAQRIVAEADPESLRRQGRFFEDVYKPRRDELAARWSALGGTTRRSRRRAKPSGRAGATPDAAR